nr:Os12g0119175 [Ipomoea batatas]GMD17431.1 Os12g0119175 [Ipomoea batatas]
MLNEKLVRRAETSILSSTMAKCCPTQSLGPNPNGKNECCSLQAPLTPLANLSGLKESASDLGDLVTAALLPFGMRGQEHEAPGGADSGSLVSGELLPKQALDMTSPEKALIYSSMLISATPPSAPSTTSFHFSTNILADSANKGAIPCKIFTNFYHSS